MGDAAARRTFLISSAFAAGTLLTGLRAAQAAEPQALKSYIDVDPALFVGINRVKDPGNLTALEKKHAPVIDLPAKVKAGEPFTVKVAVGETIHPMATGHYIHCVDVYVGNEPAGRVEFSPNFGVPEASLTLKLDKPVTLVVREYCNLHGLWESRKDVEIG